ncbi:MULTISPECIES: hypothetical protein [unclassified Clostridium]|uniref:hypothetical protein n=1 Tax=unclassified Clostridium TaxID=2614128 RepID=UPI0005FB0C27|nr:MULTISPECIES: hypothetical protein [unclassified Clostridium]KJZ95390.1 hypothetical protein ClosIBUN62F_CONTIG14g00734 [Clostridium sp. IBUN62F]KJZ96943.1 hypothetical protein ClosIBUN22A_CONTIG100g02102 [Clostridium sp. IBUN22A]MBS5983880.1 hypothetical protein [Clostridium butyricum]
MEEIKRIPNIFQVHNYLITFSYETFKGYYREQQREINTTDKESAKVIFNRWLNTAERKRTMTNVKILGIVENKEKSKTIVV